MYIDLLMKMYKWIIIMLTAYVSIFARKSEKLLKSECYENYSIVLFHYEDIHIFNFIN